MDYKSKKSTLSGEKSQRSGHKSDKPQQNNSTSRVDADHGGEIIHCPVTKNMKHLLDEFKGLYEERLRRLEFDTRGGTNEDILQMKVRILQSYVNDLGEQNQVLVQTVEDLETEANNRVCTIEAKLRTSDQIIHELEQQRRVLEESVCSLRSENRDRKTDMDSLTNFIQQARHQHTLVVSGVTLRTGSLEKMIETSTHTPMSPNLEVEDLRSQLRTRDRTILCLERDIKTFQLENNTLNKTEVESVREEEERQRREILTLRQREKTLLSELQTQERRLCETQRESRMRVEDTARLQSQLHQVQSSHTQTMRQAEAKMVEVRTELGDEYERRLEEKEERMKRITEDLNNVREKHTSARDQLRSTEGILQSLRMQLQDRDSQLENATNKMFTLENSLKEAEESCVAAKTEVQTQTTLLEELSRELGRLTLAENTSVNELGEMLRHMKQDLSALKATQDSLKRTLSMKEQHTHQLTHDNTHLRQNLDTLKNKLHVSEDRVCTLSVELDQLKIGLGKERDQCQHLQNQVLQQSQDLERASNTLTDTRRAAGRKIHKKDSKLSVLLKELTEVRKNFSDCKKELLSRESALAKQQEETAQLRSKMEDCSSQCSALNREKERLETILTLTKQKHCTAQGEVSSRDQGILHLRIELSQAEQKYQGTQEELAMLEAEVSRLNQKVKGQQEDACLLRQMVREGEGLRDQEVMERQQIQNALCIAHQQVKSQTMSIEQLTSDLDSMKQNHRADTERWSHRHFLLSSQLEQASSELSQAQAEVREHGSEVTDLRGKLQLAEERYQEALEKVEVAKGLENTRDTEIELLRQQLTDLKEDLSETTSRTQGQEEKAAIFKQKYCVAMEKVQQLQGHIECVEEELRYTQQQLTESKAAVDRVKAELTELEGRYEEKLGQWERSEEALDQLTNELQANQMALREGRERVEQCEGTIQHLQQEVDTQNTQIIKYESSLKSYQQNHSYSDEQYCALQRLQLQKQSTEQVERLANCEQALLQMRTEYLRREEELEKQSQEKAGLERTLQSLHLDMAASHRKHLVTHTQLEQEVTQLQEEVTRLQDELVETHDTCTQRQQTIQGQDVLLQQVEEDLKETKLLLQRRTKDLKEEKDGVQRLRKEAQEQREEEHRLVEELSCRGEEVWRLEGSVREGRQAEERRRLTVERLERQSAELRLALQQAMENTLNTQRDNHTTQEQVKTLEEENNSLTNQVRTLEEKYSSLTTQLLRSQSRGQDNVQRLANQEERLVVLRTESETLQEKYSSKVQELDTLRLEVEGAYSDNTHLRQGSQVVMANVNRWVKEQRVASESLAAKIRGQNKVLLIISEEKQHLQEANRALEEELRKLGDEGEEKEREMERLKAQVQDRGQQQEEERESFVTTNLSRIQYMQVRLRSNLEAIGLLNKQLSALGGENERLRLQLEEERAERRRVERLIPPTNHRRGTSLLPLSLTHGSSSSLPSLTPSLDRDTGYPPPASHLSPSPFHHSPSHSPSPRPGEDSALTRAELSVAGPREPGEAQAVNEAYWVRRVGELSVQLQDRELYWSGRINQLATEIRQTKDASPLT
ncbi:polyamine-modulated factor 1-binding protein 1-like isoform X4 [Salvelinus fontinalis]|uniref:polyamine-modulated factor 1-binding protein 1-like isoform X4 n=1 Tax=Salvelinus fontinalis TaxID=8038 RepID=UPI0024866CAF|nr:polyamine-modulated factor 1-binding protein 1-like isoform X4 [Salvelinus fontinalis]